MLAIVIRLLRSHICEEVDGFFSFYEKYLSQCVDLCTMERFLQFFDFCFHNASFDKVESAPQICLTHVDLIDIEVSGVIFLAYKRFSQDTTVNITLIFI